jgi:anti-sigma B factor antagonist
MDDTQTGISIAPHPGDDDVVVLDLVGYLDLSNAHLLAQAIDEALADSGEVRLNLSGLSFVDSTGLREFVLGYRRAEAAGRGFRVTGAQGPVHQVLEIAGMLDFLGTGVARQG